MTSAASGKSWPVGPGAVEAKGAATEGPGATIPRRATRTGNKLVVAHKGEQDAFSGDSSQEVPFAVSLKRLSSTMLGGKRSHLPKANIDPRPT